ncbi:MAG: hypothetical protein ACTHMG_10815 [Sphingomonas sp.]
MLRTFVALSLMTTALVAPAAAQTQQQVQAQQQDADPNTRTLAEAEATAPTPAATPADGALGQQAAPPKEVRSVTLVGDEKCPVAKEGEVVVCSRMDDGDRYRIPGQFRQLPNPAENNSWTNRAAVADQVGREAAGLPNTCSVVGDGGQSGCTMQMLRQYSAEKRAQKREAESIP